MKAQNHIEEVIDRIHSPFKSINSEMFYISHSNEDYKIILEILNKFGPLTIEKLKEKLKEYLKGKRKVKSNITYYRFLQDLKKFDLVIEVGRQIHPKKTSAKILYNRTAKLFIPTGFGNEIWPSNLGFEVAKTLISIIDPNNINNSNKISSLIDSLSNIEFEEIEILHTTLRNILSLESELTFNDNLFLLDTKDSIQFWSLLRFLIWFISNNNYIKLILLQSFSSKNEKPNISKDSVRSIEEFKSTNDRDLTNYQILPVLSTSDKVHRKYFTNRNYKAILQLLYRKTPKTLKEIAEKHQETVLYLIKKEKDWYSSKKLDFEIKIPKAKKLDTIYRYLTDLQEGGLVIEAGRRVTPGKSYTEILYSRTAVLYYYWGNELDFYNTESWKIIGNNLINSLEQLLKCQVIKKTSLLSIISEIERERTKTLHDCLESNIDNNILLESMDSFTDEQHVLFLESLSLLSWLEDIDIEKLRLDILNCLNFE